MGLVDRPSSERTDRRGTGPRTHGARTTIDRKLPRGPRSDGHGEAATDRLYSQVAERLNARGRIFLTPTVIRGRASLRASVIHYDVG